MAPVFGDTAQTYWQRVALMRSMSDAQTLLPIAWYEMLEEYYLNNGLYDDIQAALHENAIWAPGMKPIRNPAHRAVEFHVAKLWAGPLEKAFPIVSANTRLADQVATIDAWSNWGSQKQLAARWFSMLGDLFVKVAVKLEGGKVTRVYKDPIKPAHVTEFDLDERGFITYIRIDIPAGEDIHTEIWSKARGGYAIYKHNRTTTTPVSQLGTPSETGTFAQLGFDFIPIVHAKFIDIGETRGVACFVHALDKIDEANRQATRLHQILFRYNKATTAISANAQDSQGKPLPPPRLDGASGTSSDDGGITKGDDDLLLLPGMSTAEQLVPNLNYADALAILNAQMDEIRMDLSEILYYELGDQGELSSLALKTLLGPAIDRVIEARGNAEPALVRANQMALTIAQIHRLPGFENLGTYESGALDHTFAARDVIPMSAKERAETIQMEVQAGTPLPVSMKRHGYNEEEIADVVNSLEYRLTMAEKLLTVVQQVGQTEIPLETFLRAMGWKDKDLQGMGVQRLAEIKLRQEDRIPPVRQ